MNRTLKIDRVKTVIRAVKNGVDVSNYSAKVLTAEIERLTEELEYSQKLFEQLTGGQDINERPGREM